MNRARSTAMATVCVLALALSAAGTTSALASPAHPPATNPTASNAVQAPSGLPRPTGPHAVGRSILHLVDEHRQDPWVPSAGARQLMVSMYYPARPRTGGPAPYMTEDEARLLLQEKAPGSPFPAEKISEFRTWARSDAAPAGGRFPLVVLSPGFTLPRATLSGLAEDLASRGYVVALVDHTYESSGTTFPDGRTLPCAICDQPPAGGPATIEESRARDVSFVLDQLTGRHPAWRHARMIDAGRIAMAGHSIGGAASAVTMAADHRVRAGINLDGTFFAPVPDNGLDGRPFLMFGEQTSDQDDTWNAAWSHLNGWKRWLSVAGSEHGTFTDLPLLASLVGAPSAGGITPQRSEELTRTYVAAFLDLHLKGIPQSVLDGPSAADPEVTVRLP
ncbi:alpha/beta hydrolase family protein [Streptomyces sp. NBC_01431]|uniref:alpha/beta hydrolase family protein n=1 Tax=Streptomyces sp. NBC_01431 TaxID=2903863 RepID=UPI002E31351F|nr:alpha/beta hydrolase [Streptomyces sp. NBC_01431]